MLKNLRIKNYALIRDLDLEFGDGLTTVTGETGAGKSIMLGALSLVMGGRADTKMISDGDSKSVVEATFIDVDPELRSLFEEKGIDWTEDEAGVSEMTIRREITSSGRSKVLVNDSSVTLQTLSQIMPRLIDIHSQHANAKINDPAERLRIIDSIAGNEQLLSEYRQLFDRYVELRRKIKTRKENAAKSAENLEFMKFRLAQLEKLSPKRGELREIERRFEALSDADDVKMRLSSLAALLGDSMQGVGSILSEAVALAEKVDFMALMQPRPADEAARDAEPSVTDRLKALAVEAKDLFETVEDLNGAIDTDPATLARLSDRMNLYYETVKGFRVKDADELVDIHDRLRREVNDVEAGDDSLPALEAEARSLGRELKEKADLLTQSRTRCAGEFSELLRRTAAPLGLPNVNFLASVSSRKLCASGQDEVEFLCSFNKQGVPKPLADIASGGEIARMMLSLKSILAGHINLPTIIFDEVDTGVSGEIADKMGEMMHNISSDMQVVVITHLPQVAAKGDEQLKVYKTDVGSRTETHVSRLDEEGRVRELAAMISGSEVSEAALSAARNLLTPKHH